MTQFEMIKTKFGQAVPFAGHTGIEVLEVGPGLGIAQLRDSPQVRNHIGSVHAGAIMTLGETASGVAMLGAFADQLASIRPLTSDVTVNYLKIARGTLTVDARTDVSAEELRRTLSAEGRAIFSVAVNILDGRQIAVARLVAKWSVTSGKRRAD